MGNIKITVKVAVLGLSAKVGSNMFILRALAHGTCDIAAANNYYTKVICLQKFPYACTRHTSQKSTHYAILLYKCADCHCKICDD